MNQALRDEIAKWGGQYVYLLPFGLGDTLEVCSYINDVQKQVGGSVRLLVKQPHEFIVKDCGITNYATLNSIGIADGSSSHAMNLDLMRSALHDYIVNVPQVGRVYIAHPGCNADVPYNKNLLDLISRNAITFNDFYKKFFHIDSISTPVRKIALDKYRLADSLKGQIEERIGAKIQDVVLVIFECRSSMGLTDCAKATLLQRIQKEFPNSRILLDSALKGLRLEQLISVAAGVKHVYAYKSGICDVLVNLGRKLTVFYPHRGFYDTFSAQSMYEHHAVDERIL